jgi:tRNA(Ile)-lysidine synthetase-like protein
VRKIRADVVPVCSLFFPRVALLEGDGVVKIPVNYFSYPIAATNRILRKAFKGIGIMSDIERKHLKIINGLALEAENGAKITLPNKVSVIKEYNFITITNKNFTPEPKTWPLERGKIDIPNFGIIEMQVTRKLDIGDFSHLMDYNKIPKNAIWRYRKDGDIFEKFGGGTKSLSDYLIDKKVPVRLRALTPVLAVGNEILIIAGVEISDKVKIDENTKMAYAINVKRF